jgi:hypothetical protein
VGPSSPMAFLSEVLSENAEYHPIVVESNFTDEKIRFYFKILIGAFVF